MQMSTDVSPSKRFLGEPALRRVLVDFVRKRVPAADVDDVVQTVLMEALAAPARPQEQAELTRWLLGIARHKVVDHHRRTSREAAAEIPDLPAPPPPLEEQALVTWAEKQAGPSSDARNTLEWMAREGEGEKLETIAAEEQVPAARIRQRVSRMRRWMKERWLAELAAAAALVVLGIVLWRIFRKEEPITQPQPEPRPVPSVLPDPVMERARSLREMAFESCDRSAWKECLDKLDEAKQLDPAGDADPRVGAARARAAEALQNEAPQKSDDRKEAPPPTAKPSPTSAPTVAPKRPVPTKAPPPVKSDPPTPKKPSPKEAFLKSKK